MTSLIIIVLLTVAVERAIMANSWYHYSEYLHRRLRICQNTLKQLEDENES
jgi:hypothetical protein